MDSDGSHIVILGISGSLRRGSSNTLLLEAAGLLAPHGVSVTMYDGLGALPQFNPDLDDDAPPEPVRELREKVRCADAVLICSPEYAAGVPGSMKNALDWLVGTVDIVGKPVASINASPWSTLAQASLLGTLSMISAVVVDEACVSVPLRGKKLDAQGIASDADIALSLEAAIAALLRAVRSAREASA